MTLDSKARDAAVVDRVARAIYGVQDNAVPWDRVGDWRKDYEREKARAALAALDRDPLVEAARVARVALKRRATPDDREAAIRALDAALGCTDPCVAGPQGCDVRPADEMVRCSVCGELVCDLHGEYVSDEAYVRGDFRCPDHLDAALGEGDKP